MIERPRPDSISADEAERILAGAMPDADDRPALTLLNELLAAAGAPGDEGELAQAARAGAAFRGARVAVRQVAPPKDTRLNAITRRTIAILSIATGASLGAALAAGAVGNPFAVPSSLDHAPVTTTRPLSVDDVPTDTVGKSRTLDQIAQPSPTVTLIDNDPAPPAPSPTPLPSSEATNGAATVDPEAAPSVTAPGQSGQSPSVRRAGSDHPVPSVTAPGQGGQSPWVTAPGQTTQSPSVTAPGQAGQSPSVTAPGQTPSPRLSRRRVRLASPRR